MRSEMATAFMQGAGFNPQSLKYLLFVMVFVMVFSIGAWLGTLVLKAFGDGELDASEAMKACIGVAITVLLVVGVLGSIILK
ncbi:UNVERIFIED_CONTAM: DUF3262 family protein [Comamonas sp. A-3]|uniref:DUF3262 family protein n=1 Tax=unclassified Comamonas TaxID=2638500 RepID=UPI000C17953E|nr:DUF3262 family protein [Comamonas sp. 26]PIG08978.1 integrating conjugative element protein (TIGR03758 family) [Comamonas sp. 26]